MTSRKNTIVALVVTAISAGAIGLPWAMAGTGVVNDSVWVRKNCVRFNIDDKPACGLRKQGPRGFRGVQGEPGIEGARGRDGSNGTDGRNGADGPQGPQGAQGAQGAVGATGLTGPKGDTGPQGIQGVQGAPGHTVVVAGTVVTATANPGPMTGTILGPSIARCPAASSGTPEAYGGGVKITKSGSQSSSDVVGLEQHYAGTFNDNGAAADTVDALPSSTTPGDFSTIAANAYMGQAVITQLNSGDTVKVQAFAVCGP